MIGVIWGARKDEVEEQKKVKNVKGRRICRLVEDNKVLGRRRDRKG